MSSASASASASAPLPVAAGTLKVLQIGLAKQRGTNSCYAATASAAYNFVSPKHKITERDVCKYVASVKKSSPKNASPKTTEIEDPILFLQGHRAFSSAIAPTDHEQGQGPGLCKVIKDEIDLNTPMLMLLGEHYVTVVGYRVNVDCESDTSISPTVFDILISDPDPQTKSDYWYNLGSLTSYASVNRERFSVVESKKIKLALSTVSSSVGQEYRGIVLVQQPPVSSKPMSPSAARDTFYSSPEASPHSPSSKKKSKVVSSRASGASAASGTKKTGHDGRGGSIGRRSRIQKIRRRNKNQYTKKDHHQRRRHI